jgi:hypothetical protein
LTLISEIDILMLRSSEGSAMGIQCPKCQHENPDDTLYCGKCGTLLPSVRGTDPTDVGPDPRSGRPIEDNSDLTKTIEAPKEELTTGSTFAERYQIIEELGKGGQNNGINNMNDTVPCLYICGDNISFSS